MKQLRALQLDNILYKYLSIYKLCVVCVMFVCSLCVISAIETDNLLHKGLFKDSASLLGDYCQRLIEL